MSIALLEIVSDRLHAAREMLHQAGAAPVERRVASLLLRLAERAGNERSEGWLIQMPLGRQDIADMLGITVRDRQPHAQPVPQRRPDPQWAPLDRDR